MIQRINPNRVRNLHARGRTDGQIARTLGCDRTGVRACRVRLGLRANGPNAESRRATYAGICRSAGYRNLARMRYARERERMLAEGWPAGCSAKLARWLDVLHRLGPLPTSRLAAELGHSGRLHYATVRRLRKAGWLAWSRRGDDQVVWDLAAAVRAGRDRVLARRDLR